MFEIHDARGGGFFWRLLAASNGQILCHSEVYTTKASAQKGIDAVRRLMPNAQIFDLTR